MITVAGDRYIHKKIWLYLRKLYLKPQKIVVIDAANRFDPYFISKICVSYSINPYLILDNIVIARAFTPFQLIKLLEKIPYFEKIPFICLGINNLFEDENISTIHSWKLFRKTLNIVKKLKNPSIITAEEDVSTRGFVPYLKKESEVFIREEKVIKPSIKNGEKKLWEGQLHHLLQY